MLTQKIIALASAITCGICVGLASGNALWGMAVFFALQAISVMPEKKD